MTGLSFFFLFFLSFSFSSVFLFLLLPLLFLCLFFLFFLLLTKVALAATWLNFRFTPIFSRPCLHYKYGPRSRSCISSSLGSGHYASESPGGSSSVLRTVHWMGRLQSFITFPLGTLNLQRSPHVCPFTSIIHSTDYGFPWRHPITDDSESWTQPAANHASPNTPPWDWSYFRFTQWTPQSNFHDGTTHRPNFQNFSPSRTSPGHDQDHYPCPCSIQAMGLIDWGPTTEKETKIRFSPRSTYSCYWTTWPSRPASHRLRSTSWRPQLRWFWLWCSVGSRSHTWSLRHRHQLSLPSIIHHHFHNTTWHFHSYTDAESKGTTTINYSAKPSRPSSWSAIPSMDQYRWSRAD